MSGIKEVENFEAIGVDVVIKLVGVSGGGLDIEATELNTEETGVEVVDLKVKVGSGFFSTGSSPFSLPNLIFKRGTFGSVDCCSSFGGLSLFGE